MLIETDERRRQKLTGLKERIRNHGRFTVREYEGRYAGLRIDPTFLPEDLSEAEDDALKDGVVRPDEWASLNGPVRDLIETRGTVALDGLEAFGQQVLEDLWQAVEAELGRPVRVLDAHEQERAYHEWFVLDRARLFLGRTEIMERIRTYLDEPGSSHPLVVTGPAGCGKSAILAQCVRVHHELSPKLVVVPHFIGVSPGSDRLQATLRALWEELRRKCRCEEEVPEDPQHLRQGFKDFLRKVAERNCVVLVLDALNQLDPLDRSQELGWLPLDLPEGLKIVVSAPLVPAWSGCGRAFRQITVSRFRCFLSQTGAAWLKRI